MTPARAAVLLCALALPACSSSPTTPTATGTARRLEVTVPGAGVTLGGVLHRPDSGGAPAPAIVLLHGWQPAGTNGAALLEARATRYAAEGYAALALSMRGWPPSGGTDDCGLHQPDDIVRAVAWLATQPGIDAARIALVGFSQGGQVALLAGARGAAVRGIVAYYPVTDVARWKATTAHPEIPQYVTAVCEPGGTGPRSPLSDAARIAAPVLLVHGDADTRVPTEQAILMAGALRASGRSVELLLVPGAQHGFTAAEEAVARPVVDRFLGDR